MVGLEICEYCGWRGKWVDGAARSLFLVLVICK